MPPIELGGVRDLIEAAVTAVSVLGGFMAGFSGHAASKAVAERTSPEVVGRELNEGLALGFDWGALAAVIVFLVIIGV